MGSTGSAGETQQQPEDDGGARKPTIGEAHFRTLIERSLDAVILFDPDGTVRYASPSSAKLMGYTPAELIGRDGFETVHPDDRDRVREVLGRIVSEPRGTATEVYRVRHKDGSWRWLEARGTNLLDEPGLAAVAATYRDVTDQRATEEVRARLAAIIESAQDAIVGADPTGTILTWNPAAERLFGYTLGEIIGRHITVLAAPDQIVEEQGFIKRLVRGEQLPPFETTRLRKDWRVVPVSLSLSVIRHPAGNLLGFSASYRDLTPEQQARDALRRSEEKYRELFEQNPHPMWVYAVETLRFLAVNDAAVDQYGYSRDEFLGMTILDIRPPEDVSTLLASVRHATPGLLRGGVWRHRHKDGRTREAEVASHAIRYDGRPARLVLATDVTARRRAEMALREREELFRNVIAHIPCGVFWKDRNSVYLGCNDQMARDLGFASPDQVVGRTDAALGVTPTEAATYRDADKQVVETGSPVLNREESQTRPGGKVTLLTSKVPLRDAAGAVVGVLGVYQDITDRKKLEEQYRQAQRMEAVGRLAGGVAHDFNNLLTVITGYSDLVLIALPGHDPAWPLVEEIKKAGERAAVLTQQLLAFGRKQMLQQQVLNLNEVVTGLEKMLRRIIGEDIRLATLSGPDLLRVKADPVQVEQVILNLAVNARDAMPTGGRLTIETANMALPRGPGGESAVRPGPYVLLSVSDTGCGIPADVLPHVFEPFYTTKPVGQGTGMGLATVYGIATAHGGHVEVESTVGRGTTFRVYWPAAEELSQETDRPAGETRLPRGTEVVMVAEDEEGVRGLARLTLQKLGYTVLVAANAEQTLAAARASDRPMDLLLTDVVMPGMSGRALAERMLAEYPGLKVLYTSGYTDDAVVRYGVESDRVNFLPKPYTPAILARKVREVLDAGR
ncbi:MAG: Blue-light-activated protein [Gemmataceae bacterium]|nr:Blue-light-activated protein [Gemmataceae bacterium]